MADDDVTVTVRVTTDATGEVCAVSMEHLDG
jgi:hypothetical protein